MTRSWNPIRTGGTRAAHLIPYLLDSPAALTVGLALLLAGLTACSGDEEAAATPSAADEVARIEAKAANGDPAATAVD